MEKATAVSSRRGLLRRALALASAALGFEALGVGAANGAVPGSALVLGGRGFHLHSDERRPGEPPLKGDRVTGYGELLMPDGSVAGHFTSTYVALDSPFAAPGSLEVHALNLSGGTLHGIGGTSGGPEGHFSIVGGTGEYAGVRGTYVARQAPREHGGDGSAHFELTLYRQEA